MCDDDNKKDPCGSHTPLRKKEDDCKKYEGDSKDVCKKYGGEKKEDKSSKQLSSEQETLKKLNAMQSRIQKLNQKFKSDQITSKIPSITSIFKFFGKKSTESKKLTPDEEDIKKLDDMQTRIQKLNKKFRSDGIAKSTLQSCQFICKNLKSIADWIYKNCDPKKMSDKSGPSKPMKFPYTFSAKLAQFPLKFYVNNQWMWRYYLISVAVCFPVFYSINKLANSPANVAKWAEIRRKEALEHHH